MARLGDGEPSVSVLERLLANAALRDASGRLHRPEARACPPAGVSQGGWGVGLLEPWLGLSPVPGAVPPVSPEGQLSGLPGAGWAEGILLREAGVGNS